MPCPLHVDLREVMKGVCELVTAASPGELISDSPFLGLESRRRVSGNEEQRSHGVHVTQRCKHTHTHTGLNLKKMVDLSVIRQSRNSVRYIA